MKKSLHRTARIALALCCLFALLALPRTTFAQSGTAAIPASDLVQPDELANLLTSKTQIHPLVLQVGSHVLYQEAHIPGAEYASPGGQPAGLENLQQHVATLPHSRFIVLYCGCCPWNRCPNIKPAYDKMLALGFTNVKVLYIANNFGANWVDQGYPTAKGQ